MLVRMKIPRPLPVAQTLGEGTLTPGFSPPRGGVMLIPA